jgi:MFS family permease
VNQRQQQLVFYIIVVAQFCGTSLWFAGNAVLPQLQLAYRWPASALGYLTSSTQVGFIAGTLCFAALGLVDRYSPSRLFFICTIAAAFANLLALADPSSFGVVLVSRCLTGFFLAGIYPVGMKIAADWKQQGLGHWLGWLVGALVLGTAFPQAMKLEPQFVKPAVLLTGVSLLSVAGAILLYALVPDGPYRKKGHSFSFAAMGGVFRNASFRGASFGYFGHMWEVYAFWAFVPWAVINYPHKGTAATTGPLLSFVIIAAGALGCVAGGQASFKVGSERVAVWMLVASGICCLLSPFIWGLPLGLFLAFMIFWGATVAADSPQFSALVARSAPEHLRGSAITLTTCIGFSITIVSIQLLNYLQQHIHPHYLFLFLLPGPVAGVLSMTSARRVSP